MQFAKSPGNQMNIQPPVKHYRLRQIFLALLIFGLMLLVSFMTIPVTGNVVPENDLGALIGLASLIFAGIIALKASGELMK